MAAHDIVEVNPRLVRELLGISSVADVWETESSCNLTRVRLLMYFSEVFFHELIWEMFNSVFHY